MEITFVVPLALLPGVALLIVSTSARYAALHDEVHRLLDRHDTDARADVWHRARLFRNALVAMYLCAAIFALTGLTGTLLTLVNADLRAVSVVLTGIGCACLLYACVQLVRETLLSLDIIEHHLHHTEPS